MAKWGSVGFVVSDAPMAWLTSSATAVYGHTQQIDGLAGTRRGFDSSIGGRRTLATATAADRTTYPPPGLPDRCGSSSCVRGSR